MDIQINKNELKMHWVATFIDGTVLRQFDQYGKEVPFSEVKKKFTLLETFQLVHTEKPLTVTADLLRGLLFIGKDREVEEDFKKKKEHIRLIYFRRNKIEFDANMIEVGEKTSYFIGYQYNSGEWTCKKVIMHIDADGQIMIGD